ncbi:MAG: hypothetical protein JSU00_31420 [Acidobacteria bacterium]|nr:hypothetical protein [Acidobacteriota bacterium]
MPAHPCFEIPLPNRPIVLGAAQVSVRLGGKTLTGPLTATVTMVPRPKLEFEFEVPPYFGIDISNDVDVTFLSSGAKSPCRIARGRMFSQAPSSISLRPLQEVVPAGQDMLVKQIVFAVPNFPDFLAHAVIHKSPEGGGVREDEIRLEFSGWHATIRKMADIAERKELLSEDGGFGITAIGLLERTGAALFTWQNAEPAIEALGVFLSFVCGRWTGPMLPAGIGLAGEPIWFRWSVPLVDQGFSLFTWFDAHRGMTLSDIVPSFMAKWEDPQWKYALSRAVYWFVRANSVAVGGDGSLILSQAALEVLSWTYLVMVGGMEPKAFKRLGAAGRIRTLLKAMEIPVEIPASLTQLSAVAADGPGAVVAVRNDLVHPDKREGPLPATEAWTLAQRYVELVILRLCGFSGEHANRTQSGRWVGQVELVPWA